MNPFRTGIQEGWNLAERQSKARLTYREKFTKSRLRCQLVVSALYQQHRGVQAEEAANHGLITGGVAQQSSARLVKRCGCGAGRGG